MSKKFKKLLCGLLACAMISTSGIMAMADEPADTDAASDCRCRLRRHLRLKLRHWRIWLTQRRLPLKKQRLPESRRKLLHRQVSMIMTIITRQAVCAFVQRLRIITGYDDEAFSRSQMLQEQRCRQLY